MFELVKQDYFNTIEGTFWITLAGACVAANRYVPARYRTLCLFTCVVLFVFGISDFMQVLYGSFLVPGMEWLFVWKIINLMALGGVVPWYLWLRLSDS